MLLHLTNDLKLPDNESNDRSLLGQVCFSLVILNYDGRVTYELLSRTVRVLCLHEIWKTVIVTLKRISEKITHDTLICYCAQIHDGILFRCNMTLIQH